MQSRPRSNRCHRDLEDRRGGLPSLPGALLAATINIALAQPAPRRGFKVCALRPAPHRMDYVARYVFSRPQCTIRLASHHSPTPSAPPTPSLLHAEYREQVAEIGDRVVGYTVPVGLLALVGIEH